MSTNLQVLLFQEEHKEAPPDLGQAADPKWPIGYMQCHQGAMAELPPHTHTQFSGYLPYLQTHSSLLICNDTFFIFPLFSC